MERRPTRNTPMDTPTASTKPSRHVTYAKNIVICCDGTGRDLSKNQTNVALFFRALEVSSDQLVYYDPGVGTLDAPGALSPEERKLDKFMDLACGYSIEYQACKAYNFLLHHWAPGDKIYLVGFSRGAYSVRALAGLLSTADLVRRELEHLVPLAWKHYANKNFVALRRFQSSFCRNGTVPIHFIGVWDTVSSFGRITNFKTLPATANNTNVKHVRHAMAIDERRACFGVSRFTPPNGGANGPKYESFKEVRFPGVHGDVGGGFNESEGGLSKTSLKWMLGEAAELGCKFNTNKANTFLGLDNNGDVRPNVAQPIHNSMTRTWSRVESFPRRQWSKDRKRMEWRLPNLFHSRTIPPTDHFHESVVQKLKVDKNYAPKNVPHIDQMTLSYTAKSVFLEPKPDRE